MKQSKAFAYIIIICLITFSCSKSTVEKTLPAPPPPVEGKTFSASQVTAFKQMTLDVAGMTIKWPGKISLYIVDTGYSQMNATIDSIIHELNILLDTNLVVTRTNDPIAAGVKVYLTDRDTYIRIEPGVAPTLQNSELYFLR